MSDEKEVKLRICNIDSILLVFFFLRLPVLKLNSQTIQTEGRGLHSKSASAVFYISRKLNIMFKKPLFFVSSLSTLFKI